MLKISIVLTLFAIASANPFGFPNRGRIVGGDEVKIEDYPYQISLQYNGNHRCGGSVIQPNIILTAAHCLENKNTTFMSVRAGSTNKTSGGVVVNVLKYFMHEKYNTNTMDYDIGFIVLDKPLPYGSHIQPIEMADHEALDDANAVVSGWGNQEDGVPSSPYNLRAVTIRIINKKLCKSIWDETTPITDRMTCAGVQEGGKGSCQGDSGGPLAVNGKLTGVVSFSAGCARPETPTIFSNVANLSNWVNLKIKNV